MDTRGRSAWLICSVLLGVLVISCGGSAEPGAPAPSVPAQPATPTQDAETTTASALTTPAPDHHPQRPAPPPPPPPPPPGRPGGGLLELNEATGVTLEEWKAGIDSNCAEKGYKAGCLNPDIQYYDNVKNSDAKCNVENVDPPSKYEVRRDQDGNEKKYVEPGTTVTVEVSCDPPSESTTSSPNESFTPNTLGESDTTGGAER